MADSTCVVVRIQEPDKRILEFKLDQYTYHFYKIKHCLMHYLFAEARGARGGDQNSVCQAGATQD